MDVKAIKILYRKGAIMSTLGLKENNVTVDILWESGILSSLERIDD